MNAAEDRKTKTTGVHKANPFNSTDFSDCCGSAVLQQDSCCPSCGRLALRFEPPRSPNCLMCGKPRNECYC